MHRLFALHRQLNVLLVLRLCSLFGYIDLRQNTSSLPYLSGNMTFAPCQLITAIGGMHMTTWTSHK